MIIHAMTTELSQATPPGNKDGYKSGEKSGANSDAHADGNPRQALASAPQGRLDGSIDLHHWGVIRLEGADSASFLQGQLTQDFVLLKPNQARLAAFCSAKGRMQASFIGFKRSDTEILLLCSRDILPATLKRLSMFVMRAKTKLTDASVEFSLIGLAGSAVEDLKDSVQNESSDGLPESLSAGVCWHAGDQSFIGLYAVDGVTRALKVAPVNPNLGDNKDAAAALSSPDHLTHALWLWGEVRSGIATITAPIVDAFVPQMLNYESVGGVNFKKGCYPGQEVVARSQFRGTLKRRAYLVHCSAAMAAGDEVFGMADADQACGTVAQAAAAPGGGFDAIVSMQVAAAAAGGLTFASASGAKIELLPLPYALLEDI